MELSEDKKNVIPYLDIKKSDNTIISYIPYIQLGKKRIIYLEPVEINKQLYSYEYTLPIEEMFNDKENVFDINLCVLSLNFE